VDITANESVSETYEHFLRQSVAVVTCNKIACSSAFDNYKNLNTYQEDTMLLSCLKRMLERDYPSLIQLKT
jgi:homoserine dehydrogenase